MNHTTIISTPFHNSHSHFYDYITDFPGLPVKESLEDKHKQIMKKLRHQLLHEDPKIAEQSNKIEDYIRNNNCFIIFFVIIIFYLFFISIKYNFISFII